VAVFVVVLVSIAHCLPHFDVEYDLEQAQSLEKEVVNHHHSAGKKAHTHSAKKSHSTKQSLPMHYFEEVINAATLCTDIAQWVAAGAEVGRGGNGVALRITDADGDVYIAKTIDSQRGFNDEVAASANVDCEAHHLTRAVRNCPNAVARLGGTIVYKNGGSTVQSLYAGGRVDTAFLKSMIKQASEALNCLHTAGYIHTDIKPGNIVENGAGVFTIIDIGSFNTIGNDMEFSFTPWFACVLWAEDGTFKAAAAFDIFSLGLTAIDAVCKPGYPYVADNSNSAVFKLGTIDYSDLNNWENIPCKTAFQAIPAALQTLILSMISLDPAQRPTAAQINANAALD
jgi:serine/threonine protein kinase